MTRTRTFPILLPLLLASCQLADHEATATAGLHIDLGMLDDDLPGDGNLAYRGAFTCDFVVTAPIETLAPTIERDRMYMAERPGMRSKHLPMRPRETPGEAYAGGRYLFETASQAERYYEWIRDEFVLDGTPFFERSIFSDLNCRPWRVIGAHDFGDFARTQVFVRTEHFAVPSENQRGLLAERWRALREAAEARGLTSVWLLYSRTDQRVAVVYFADHAVPAPPPVLDVATLLALETSAPLGDELADLGYTRVLDRTHFILTIWFPFVAGDRGAPSLWPHSPPLPAPSCGDGVCEVSRGESHASCPADCAPACGDATCQSDESTQTCPGDCRLE